jgi:hypothetical protein
VDGLPIEITDKGVGPADSTMTPSSLDAARSILAQTHTTISIVPRQTTAHGVVAPAVRIVQQTPDGSGTVTYLLGSSAAEVQGVGGPGALVADPVDATNSRPVDGAVAPDTAPEGPLLPPTSIPGSPASGVQLVPVGASTPEISNVAVSVAGFRSFDVSSLFIGMTIASVLGLGLALLFGMVGIRGMWSPTGRKG